MRRKDFIKLSTLFGGGLFSGASYAGNRKKRISDLHPSEAFANAGIQGSMFDYTDAPIEKVRVAIVGLGNRGSTLVEMLSWLVRHNHAEIVAICDVQPEFLDRAEESIAKFQSSAPRRVDGSSDENAWQNMWHTKGNPPQV